MNKSRACFVATIGFMLLAVALWSTHRVSATRTPSELLTTGITSANTLTLNVMLNTEPTEAVVAEFARYGAVLDVISELNAVVVQTQAENLAGVRSHPQVLSVTPDTATTVAPRNAARFVQSSNG